MEQDEVHILRGDTVATPKRKKPNDKSSVKKKIEKKSNKQSTKKTNNEEGD
jgi:hypothetical protein